MSLQRSDSHPRLGGKRRAMTVALAYTPGTNPIRDLAH